MHETGNPARPAQPLRPVDHAALLATAALTAVCLIVPNSLRIVSMPLFFAATLLCVATGRARIPRPALWMWWLSAIVTTMYLLVGMPHMHPDAFTQTLFVYCIAPLGWTLIAAYLVQVLPLATIARWAIGLGVAGASTVFLYYYVFFTIGPEALTWLIAEPNVNVSQGFAGAAMHVFGPLIFITAALMATPSLVDGRVLRVTVLVTLAVAAVVSGRTALILSIPIGMLVYLVAGRDALRRILRLGAATMTTASLVALTLSALPENVGADPLVILEVAWAKVQDGGGEDRLLQGAALWRGVADHYLFGAGHGVGVEVVRNDEYPWRYELLWLATLFRVGIVGIVVYALPVLYIFARYWTRRGSGRPAAVDDFVFAGFLAALIASATNPYFESFEFQWMLAYPLIHFSAARRRDAAFVLAATAPGMQHV